MNISINDRYIVKNLNFTLNKGDKLVIIGEEGNGKSTLLKSIYEKLKERNDIKVGYMPQTYEEILNNYEYVLDFIS